MHLTIGIFGDQAIAQRLGKKGTTNDIAIYNHADSEGVFTYVCPNSEKLQPLLQALSIVDVPILVANNLTKEIGEMIIGIDGLEFEKGFIISSSKDVLAPVIKGTSLEKFEIIEESALRTALLGVRMDFPDAPVVFPIDNHFNVKGVGTIALGVLKSGKIRKYDKLIIEPIGKEIAVKGIQSQDNDIEEAAPGMRLGLNLKGVEADELKRGFVVCDKMLKTETLTISFRKSKFSKQEIKQGATVFVSIGLQFVATTVESVENNILLKCEKPVAYVKGQKCLLASTGDALPRIIGGGKII